MSSALLQFPESVFRSTSPAPDGLYENLITLVSEGICVVDRDGRIAFWNLAAESITGHKAKDVIGRHYAEGILGRCQSEGLVLSRADSPMVGTPDGDLDGESDTFLLHRDGHSVSVNLRSRVVLDESGEAVGRAELFRPKYVLKTIHDELRTARELARRDALTGLGNRRLLEEKLAKLGGRRCEEDASTAILFLDIDRFKAVNDTYGHQTGDLAILGVARTLSAVLRSFDTIGRWGGEEFVIIAPGFEIRDARVVAERLREMVNAVRIVVPAGLLRLTVSVGATVIGAAESGAEALQRADRLMYQSKEQGRNRVTVG